jgi:hypothetical protein
VKELETIRDGFTLAMERYGDLPATAGPEGITSADPVDPAEEQEPPSITHRAFTALSGFGRAAKTDEILGKANEDGGENLSHEQVRAALSYLARSKRIERPKAGVWRMNRKEAAPQSPNPAVNGAGANGASEKGPVIGGVAGPVIAGFNSH